MAAILIIDDDEAIRNLVRDALAEEGHDVLTAKDGVAGLSLYARSLPDAVIVDIIMPNMGGIEIIRELREKNPELPIIAISGGGRTRNFELLEIAKRLGANHVLTKPFDVDELRSSVADCLLP